MNKLFFGTLIVGLSLSAGCGGGSNFVKSGLSSSTGSSASQNPAPTSPTTTAPTTTAPTTTAPTTTAAATTTLAAETGNNTSGSSSFAGWTDGNMAPGNVSKVDVHKLLYAGTTAKVYAHLMPWFGDASHKNIGYTSWNAAQVALQVNDMISRGINGMVIDWYGQGNANLNTAAQLIFQEAVKHPGFEVAVMVDAGGVSGDPTTSVISELNYIEANYATSSAYMRKDGRPVIPFFGVESLAVNWATVQSSVSGNPIYVFENTSGFTQSSSDGAFSWVGAFGNPNDWGQSYLDGFYSAALSHSTEHTFASTKKGFNDTMAAWTMNRIINQNCGSTWVNTFKEIGNYYSQTNQLESLQLVTWNDYEEGTEIETGIDNCMSVSQPQAIGSTLSWSVVAGSSMASLDTIDHFAIYATTDGSNLTLLDDAVPNTATSANLAQYNVPSGATYYVKAVGVNSIVNHTSPKSN
jgi:hypothetical protein